MEEIINISNYKNDIDGLKQLIKTNLIKNEPNKYTIVANDIYIIIIDRLNSLIGLSEICLFFNNHFTRHIILYGDTQQHWDSDINIYAKIPHEKYFSHYIKEFENCLNLEQITILEINKTFIKFVLNVSNKNFIFVIKEKNCINNYQSYFEINQLEYDIKNNLLVNNLTNKTYSMSDTYILGIRNLDLFFNFNINLCDKYQYILEEVQYKPIIIFELIELVVNFSDFFNVTEINNFLLNLNNLLENNDNFAKSIKNICDNDNELNFYKQLIKFAYYLEDNYAYNIYIRYLVYEYKPLIYIITGVNIDESMFNLFDNLSIKDIICLLIFQHLIYKKRTIFKKTKKMYKCEADLLESFINGSNNSDNNNSDSNDISMDNFNLLDKHKFKSLKYLKETAKNFIKFDDLIKLVPIDLKDQIYIKNFYNINMLLYTNLKDIRKHHSLKLAYIIKRFHLVPKQLLNKIINLFNHVINHKKYDKFFLVQDNFLNIITSQVLNDWIFKQITNIPKIKFNFGNNIDCIDIIDYQDAFILLIEFIYKNKPNYLETESELCGYFESVFEATICDIRSYRIFKNESRREKQKKIKKAKKEKKESKKFKYKIVKKNILNNLEENMETSEDTSSNSLEYDIMKENTENRVNTENIENMETSEDAPKDLELDNILLVNLDSK